MNRVELKEWSKNKIKGNKWTIISVGLVLLSLSSIGSYLSSQAGIVVGILFDIVSAIFNVGAVVYMVSFINDRELRIDMLWSKFNNGGKIISTYITKIITIFLHTLLFIVPGIIKSYKLELVDFILADDNYNNLSPTEIMSLSEKMMNGYKWDYFILKLSFIGWDILAIFTLGFLLIWLYPYQQVAFTKFLYDVKKKYEENNSINSVVSDNVIMG
mgnify:CR=1 FL=1